MTDTTVYCLACACAQSFARYTAATERDAAAFAHAAECAGRIGTWSERRLTW